MNYKVFLAFAAGAALGALAGVMLAKEKYQKESDEAIDSIRRYYNERETKKEAKEEPKTETATRLEPIVESMKVIANSYVDYNDINNHVIDYKEDPFPGEAPFKPYVISEADYIETNLNYSKEMMSYYPEDDVLVDIDDEPVVNYSSLVGDNLKERFEYEPDVDEIYIRNDNISRDFDIIAKEGKFFYSEDEL